MCLLHLSDASTYSSVENHNPKQVLALLRQLLLKHNKLYHTYQKTPTARALSPLADSLLQLEKSPSLRVPVFYAIPKIHKTLINPPGRPIVSSLGSATYFASVYLDKRLQPVLRHLKTVCTSSQSLILQMHDFTAPKHSIILCADVAALYPNIPINLGIQTVYDILKDLALLEPSELEFVIQLLEYVLKNNYCNFDGINYLQLKGTAMGTPTAVSYSNIFLYGVENSILAKIKPSFYTRYIDDIFAIFDNTEDAQQFVAEFDSFCPTIKLDAVTYGRKGIMLDLDFTLVKSLHSAFVTHKIYQKERNIYQYIPTVSEHKTTLFENFVLQELTRYRLACTHAIDYHNVIQDFAIRLKARGYDPSIFLLATTRVPTRIALLAKLAQYKDPSPSHYVRGNPIVSLCIPRLDPPIPWAKIFRIPDIIASHPAYVNNYLSPKVIIGSKNPPAIGSYLVRSQFRTPPPIL